ncbi:MAG: response regulator [Oscillochloris sp.]|nr:response regulator [Oscillochloris sp.]
MRPFPHVLIADDEDPIRSLLARIMARTYPAVHLSLANDGLDALRAFDHDPADLVLTNYDMPRLNGAALVQALRTRSTSVPIVMITANPTIAAQISGIDAFIVKPFRAREVQLVVTRLLPP